MVYTFLTAKDMPISKEIEIEMLSAQIRARKDQTRIVIYRIKGTATWSDIMKGNIEYARRVAKRNGYKCCI